MEIVLREIDLRVIDADIRVVGKGQADAVVESENEFTVRDVI